MRQRPVPFVALAVAVAFVCVLLGFWQLSRLEQRRQRNAIAAARVAEPIAILSALRGDSTSRLRRATIIGTLDYEHEIVLAPRSHEGSPGVNLVTPLRVAGRDTAFLVNRGWVYAADALTVDNARWHERDSTFTGYAEIATRSDGGTDALVRDNPRLLRRLDYAAVSRAIPYPVSPLYLVATAVDSAAPPAQRVARLPAPILDEGPHLGYAIQWFAFATIALVGAGTVLHQSRSADRAREGNGRVERW